MSTGLNCSFIEIAKQQWYYLLEDSNAPVMSWDWREHATAYGPFASEDKAAKHLRDNHANPGGSCINPLPKGVERLDLDKDEVLKDLIKRAQAPAAQRWGSYSYPVPGG